MSLSGNFLQEIHFFLTYPGISLRFEHYFTLLSKVSEIIIMCSAMRQTIAARRTEFNTEVFIAPDLLVKHWTTHSKTEDDVRGNAL